MGFIYILLFLTFAGLFLPGWARVSGAALKGLIFGPDGPGADWMWTGLTFVLIAATLFGPKVMYQAMERIVIGMVVFITLGLTFVAFQVGTMEHVSEMARGLVNFGHIELTEDFPFSRFFGAVVFAGAGGAGNLWYAFYLRDKNIGMGARIPSLMSAVHKHEVKERDTGFLYADTAENVRRFKDWFRYVVVDQTLFFWLLGSFTMFLFVFGALAVLHPIGLVPDRASLVWDLASILEQSMGTFGRYLFLIVGMAALFSTQLGGVDGGSRIFADLLHTNFKFGRWLKLERWYLVLVIATMIIGVFSVWFFGRYDIAGLDFLFIAALMGGFVMAVYVPMILYMNLTRLPKSARPGWINILFMVLASAMYIAFAGYTIYSKVVEIVAPA